MADDTPMLVATGAVGGRQVVVWAKEPIDTPNMASAKIMKRISLFMFVEFILYIVKVKKGIGLGNRGTQWSLVIGHWGVVIGH
jgi:hypothetical protein